MKLVRENINEKFSQEGDPIHDLGIGIMPKIKKALRGVIDLYGTGGRLEEIINEEEIGYMVEIIFGGDMGGIFSITYSYEFGWLAGYEDSFKPINDVEEFKSLEETVDRIDAWVKYAVDRNNEDRNNDN